jgi:hypothetical protein
MINSLPGQDAASDEQRAEDRLSCAPTPDQRAMLEETLLED